MIIGVADTHTIVWYLEGNPSLSVTAKSFMEEAAQRGAQIAISSITLIEILYLVEKGKLPKELFDLLISELSLHDSMIVESPVDLSVAVAMQSVERS